MGAGSESDLMCLRVMVDTVRLVLIEDTPTLAVLGRFRQPARKNNLSTCRTTTCLAFCGSSTSAGALRVQVELVYPRDTALMFNDCKVRTSKKARALLSTWNALELLISDAAGGDPSGLQLAFQKRVADVVFNSRLLKGRAFC